MYHGERFNSATHLLGLAMAMAGALVLMSQAMQSGDVRKIVGMAVFGVTMVLLYAASTFYHSIRGASKAFWAKADHCAIYLLIAGTYTPFTLVTLKGPMGSSILALEWLLAVIGIAKELWWGRNTVPSVPLYVLMGWMGMAAASSLMKGLPDAGWLWLLSGGLLYTIGVVFYALDTRLKHAHGIWHLFVLGGTACHVFTLWRYVV